MTKIYELYRYVDANEWSEELESLGVYSSRRVAQGYIDQQRLYKGSCDWEIREHELNQAPAELWGFKDWLWSQRIGYLEWRETELAYMKKYHRMFKKKGTP